MTLAPARHYLDVVEVHRSCRCTNPGAKSDCHTLDKRSGKQRINKHEVPQINVPSVEISPLVTRCEKGKTAGGVGDRCDTAKDVGQRDGSRYYRVTAFAFERNKQRLSTQRSTPVVWGSGASFCEVDSHLGKPAGVVEIDNQTL